MCRVVPASEAFAAVGQAGPADGGGFNAGGEVGKPRQLAAR